MAFRRSSSNQHERFMAYVREPAMQIAVGLFALLLLAQGAFWNHTRAIMPEMGIVPDVPGERTVRALSFGDEEAFFRLLALNIQNSGDTFGRFTALYKYDFNKLYHWFRLLDKLNFESSYLPAQAAYYFSQTQNPDDVHYIVDYLDEYSAGRIKEKWWWVIQAVYLSMHKMKDSDRALELAKRLQGERSIPIWAQQLPAFIHEERGEFGDALGIIEGIMKHPEDFTQGELNFMRMFVEERLGRMDAVKKEFDEIQAAKKLEKDAPFARIQPPPSDVGAPSFDLGPAPVPPPQ